MVRSLTVAKWYILQDSDWQWDSIYAPSIIVHQSGPEGAVWEALQFIANDSPDTDGVQLTVAEIRLVALADCEKNDDDGLWGITKLQTFEDEKIKALKNVFITDKELDTIRHALDFASLKSSTIKFRQDCKTLLTSLEKKTHE